MRRGLALGAALLVLSGCAGPSLGASSSSDFDRVMKDPRATANEIIRAAGPPDDVARDADGSVLLLWQPFIDPGDDEEELQGATAWRLYDEKGRVVQTYSSPDLQDLAVSSTQEGFLLYQADYYKGFEKAYQVDHTGKRHQVSVHEKPVAARAGDVMVAADETPHLYRPSDRTLHRLLRQPGAPRDVVQWSDAVIDEAGALWIQGYQGRRHWVAWSRDGGRTLREQALPLEHRGSTLSQPRMAVGHGVTVVLSDQVNGDAGGRAGPGYLDVVSGYGRTTRRVTVTDLPFLGTISVEPDLSVTSDGRVLLGDQDAGEWWVATDGTDTEYERLDVPDDVAFVRDLGGTLYAWGQWDHREATLQTSTDSGRTWTTFDVAPRSG